MTLNGNMTHWRVKDEQRVVVARNMKDCLEKSEWEDVFLPTDFVFIQCCWVLQGRQTGSVQLQEIFPIQALKEEKDC